MLERARGFKPLTWKQLNFALFFPDDKMSRDLVCFIFVMKMFCVVVVSVMVGVGEERICITTTE